MLANSEMDALIKRLRMEGFGISEKKFTSTEDIKQFAFDCDSMVSALEI